MEQVSCLCIGDPHFRIDNIEDAKLFSKKCVDLVKEQKPTFVVCLGDLLHHHDKAYVQPYNVAVDFMYELSSLAPTFLIIGNHDYMNASQFKTNNHFFNPLKKWKNMHIVDDVINYEVGNYNFFMCPYTPNGRFKEALDSSEQLWDVADCIFAHQEFKGCKMGAIISDTGDEWDEDYPLVISGHIHDTQQVGNNIYYVGSAMQHSFGDSSEKFVWLLTFTEDGMKRKKIDMKMKKKKLIYLNISDIDSFDVEKNTHNAYVKIAIKGTTSECTTFRESKKYKELVKQGIVISFIPDQLSFGGVVNDAYATSEENNVRSTAFGDTFKNEKSMCLAQASPISYDSVLQNLISNDEPLVKELYEKFSGNKIITRGEPSAIDKPNDEEKIKETIKLKKEELKDEEIEDLEEELKEEELEEEELEEEEEELKEEEELEEEELEEEELEEEELKEEEKELEEEELKEEEIKEEAQSQKKIKFFLIMRKYIRTWKYTISDEANAIRISKNKRNKILYPISILVDPKNIPYKFYVDENSISMSKITDLTLGSSVNKNGILVELTSEMIVGK